MSKKKTLKSMQQSAIASTNDSKGAENGYLTRDNASKSAAENGTRNKN